MAGRCWHRGLPQPPHAARQQHDWRSGDWRGKGGGGQLTLFIIACWFKQHRHKGSWQSPVTHQTHTHTHTLARSPPQVDASYGVPEEQLVLPPMGNSVEAGVEDGMGGAFIVRLPCGPPNKYLRCVFLYVCMLRVRVHAW